MDLHNTPLTKESRTLLLSDIPVSELMLQAVDQVVDNAIASFNPPGRTPPAPRRRHTGPDPGANTDRKAAPHGADAPGTP